MTNEFEDCIKSTVFNIYIKKYMCSIIIQELLLYNLCQFAADFPNVSTKFRTDKRHGECIEHSPAHKLRPLADAMSRPFNRRTMLAMATTLLLALTLGARHAAAMNDLTDGQVYSNPAAVRLAALPSTLLGPLRSSLPQALQRRLRSMGRSGSGDQCSRLHRLTRLPRLKTAPPGTSDHFSARRRRTTADLQDGYAAHLRRDARGGQQQRHRLGQDADPDPGVQSGFPPRIVPSVPVVFAAHSPCASRARLPRPQFLWAPLHC